MKLLVIVSFLFIFGCQKQTTNFRRSKIVTVDAFRNVTYVRNPDGDTIVVNLPDTIPDVFGREIPVRIRHIDTPEMKGSSPCEKAMALKARDVTTSLLKNAKKIDLENVGRDKFFRLLAEVKVDGVLVAKILLDKGYAVPYEGETKLKVNWCKIK